MSPAQLETILYARQCHVEYAEERCAEYLFIGGPRMSVDEAAARLGVTARTVCRWRARLGLGAVDVYGRKTRKATA